MTKTSFLFLLGLLVGMMGCGKSELSKKLSTLTEEAKNKGSNSSSSSGTVTDAQLRLWLSPVRNSSKADIKASDNLENLVTKSLITLPGLKSSTGGLQSNYLKVQNASDDSFSPNYADWQGKNVSWAKEDFQNFMGFAHLGKGIEKAMDLFKSSLITTKTNSAGQSIFPLKMYANECCNATATGYDPSAREVIFYTHGGSTLPYFNMIDEADVVFHEFGHVLQHTLNRTVLEVNYGANPSIDALLEGLSDFYGAALAQDDNAFGYMSNNITTLLNPNANRTGPVYKRQLNNTLRFPDNYVSDAHMDGRVVAAALNDVRKYFEGGVYPVGCSSTSCYLSNSYFQLSKAKAFEEAARLAYTAYSYMATGSTLHRYASLVVSEWNDRSYRNTGLCAANNSACQQGGASALTEIFKARGLLTSYNTVASTYVSNPAFSTTGTLGFVPYAYNSLADTDATVEPCETIMVFPHLTNTSSSTPVDWVDGLMKLKSYSGFTKATYNGSTLEEPSSSRKLIPWLKPGETTSALITNSSSRLYTQSAQGSTFIRPLSTSYKPSDVGWMFRAPASGSASITFEIELRPYNATGNYWFSKTVTQTITVSGSTNFCN